MKTNTVQESQHSWGGSWTEKKLDAFSKYVAAYLRIMNNHPNWKTIYFDGFAGSGIRNKKCESPLFKELEISEEEEKVYKGAAERVLTLGKDLDFDYYYFIDTNEESLKKLESKLAYLQQKRKNPFQFKSGDCNEHIRNLARAMQNNKDKYAALVFLDPFGMQINWESIEQLKDTRTDIWILIPTGVIVNRLLDRNAKLKNARKLESFFGLSKEEIEAYFYAKSEHTDLFGETLEIVSKISRPIEMIAKLYAQRMSYVWQFVTENPLPLVNSRNVPIFHLVFASNNATAVKIAGQIIQNV